MRTSLALTLGATLLSLLSPAAFAQSSTTSSSSSGDQSTSSVNANSITTLASATGSVISTNSSSSTATSTSIPPAPTGNVTNGADQSLYLWKPSAGLVMCQRVEFAFTGPAVPKSCGVFVTGTSTYLQQIPLGGTYSTLTAGTFSWLVDIPAGLSVEVQFWVTINGRIDQYTLHNLVVQDSGDNSCLGTGPGQNTQSIISYASQLNESYVYTPPKPSSTAKGGSNTGAIAGGVVGGLAGLALLILLIYYIYRRRTRSLSPPPPEGYDGEKPYYWGEGGVPIYGTPPPGAPTFAQMYQQQYEQRGTGGGGGGGGVVPYQPKNQTGMAMEPMPAPSSPGVPGSPAAPTSGSASEFGGRRGGGTEGLEDPSTFLSRSTMSGSGSGHR